MRLIKMLGLTAIAALVAMAFVGASTASAKYSTALCTVDTSLTCAAGNIYTGHIEALSTNPKLTTAVGTVECEHSHILGNALGLATAPNPLVGHIELISFTGNCHLGLAGCTVETKTLGLIDLLKIDPKSGFPTSGLVESLGNWVLVKCVGLIHCEYGGNFHVGEALSAKLPLNTTNSLALIHVNANVQRREVLPLEGCPLTAEWKATYSVLLPHEIFIEQ